MKSQLLLTSLELSVFQHASTLPKEKELAVSSFMTAGKINWSLILMTSFPHISDFIHKGKEKKICSPHCNMLSAQHLKINTT